MTTRLAHPLAPERPVRRVVPDGLAPAAGPRPTLRLVDAGWIVWAAGAYVLLNTHASWWAPVCVLVAVVLVWWTRGSALKGWGTPVLTVAAAIVAVWVVVTMAVGPGSGGDVIWVLPEWSAESGTPVGGPVTTGRLLGGLALGARALAHLALLALVLRCVPAERLAAGADAVLGRMAPLVHPLCFVADAVARAERSRTDLEAHGLGRLAPRWRHAAASAAERAHHWRTTTTRDDSGGRARVRLVFLTGVVVAASVLSVTRVVSGAHASVGALALGAVGGLLLSRARCVVSGPRELVPAASALLTCVLLATGVDGTLAALSLLALPVLSTALPEGDPVASHGSEETR